MDGIGNKPLAWFVEKVRKAWTAFRSAELMPRFRVTLSKRKIKITCSITTAHPNRRLTSRNSSHIRTSRSRSRCCHSAAVLMCTSFCSTFRQPCLYEVWKDIPCTYLICELDNALLPHVQVRHCLIGTATAVQTSVMTGAYGRS